MTNGSLIKVESIVESLCSTFDMRLAVIDHENQFVVIFGVSTQLQSSGLVAHENSTFRNLALAVSGPFMA